ncbi:MFS transporter [Herbiconiux liukaitaii]|uniref:MFS transporter n=1 Tax=Herbiconiux liukaitaii TaxID=3342799 RepID=UPI0035B818D2
MTVESQVPSGESLSHVAVRYEAKTPQLRRYVTGYAIASTGIALLWTAVLAILLPLHVQGIEFGQIFTGADAGVDLPALEALRTQVDAGEAVATAEQTRVLGLLAEYNAARAGSLSILSSVGIILTMLIQPLVGMLSDRTRSPWGRRAPWIASGAFIGAVLLAVLPIVGSIAMLLVVWSLVQLVVNTAQGPLSATVADRVPQERVGTVSAITGVVGFLAAGLGVAAVGALFGVIGLGSYYVLAAALAVSVVPLLLMARDKSSAGMPVAKLKAGTIAASYVIALRNRDYRWAWIAKVTLFIGYGAGSIYAIYMLQSYIAPALSTSDAAATAPLLQLAAIPGTIVAMAISGRWSDKIQRRKPFVFAASVLIAGSFLAPLILPTLTGMFVQAIVAGFGLGLFIVIDQALFISVLPDRLSAGRDLGLATMAQNIGQALGPILAGVVVAVAGGQYGPIWVVAFVIALGSAFAVLPIRGVR